MKSRRLVLALLATAGLLLGSPGIAAASVAGVKVINADPVESGGCGQAGQWKFVITRVTGIPAPASISANVAGGSPVTVALANVNQYGFASYELTTTATLTGAATTQIDEGWNSVTGNFFLSSGPCVLTAMSMSASAPLAIFGSTFEVSGRLTGSSGQPLANRAVRVVLHSIDADGKGKDLGDFPTGADGKFTLSVLAESYGQISLTGMYNGEPAAGGGEEASSDQVAVWSLPAGPPATAGALASNAVLGNGNRTTVVSGAGFAPNANIAVTIYSSPQLLATFQANDSGAFSGEVTIPDGLTGEHKLVAAGADAQGESVRYLDIAVTLTAGQGGSLPITGTSIWTLSLLGILLVAAGFGLLHWIRRRPSHSRAE